jgi:predicted RNase H-like HicB family nuclease
MRVAVVKAAHDDAGVWYVEHSDVEGLHVEGETFEAFYANIAGAAADLLEEKDDGEIQIEILAHAFVRAASHVKDFGKAGPSQASNRRARSSPLPACARAAAFTALA